MIIYVDPVDELNTIVHRIRMEKDSEILLVVPPENWVLRDEINVKLLAKYAKDSQKQLIIQTGDPLVIKYAEANQIPVVCDESAAAKDEDSPEMQERRRRQNHSRGISDRVFVLLLTLTALLGFAYYHLPKAVVVVTPKLDNFRETLQLPLNELSGVEQGIVQTTLTRKTPATGRKTVGITRASGAITLINQSQNEVLVAEGTIVETGSGILFRTSEDVVVPAVTTQYFMDIPTGLAAGRAEVGIEAVEPGSRGNVAAGRIDNVRGYDLEVRNMDPTSGGEDVVLQVAAQSDIERVQSMVRRDSEQELLDAMLAELEGRVIIDESFKIDIEWTSVTEIGEETSEVYATGVCIGRAYLVDTGALSSQVADRLAALVPDGFIINPHSVVINSVNIIGTDAGLHLSLDVSAVIEGSVDAELLAQQLAGKDETEFAAVIAANPGVGGIYIENGAKDKLPQLPRWLKIKVEQPVY